MMFDSPNVSTKTPITVAHGDGIGPEIIEASSLLKIETLRTFDGKTSDGETGFTLAQGR